MAFQVITELEATKLISYTRTVLGWYNFTADGKRYNIDPDLFREITLVENDAVCGVLDVTQTELNCLINGGVRI